MTINEIYNKNRVCKIINKDGSIALFKEGNRMTLGYDKANKLIEFSNISMNKSIVVNLFSGAGGILKLLSLYEVNLIIGMDILYRGENEINNDWTYANQIMFENWSKEILNNRIKDFVRWPIFIQHDCTKIFNPLIGIVDLVVIDPPFGWVTNDCLTIDNEVSKDVFIRSILASINYLKHSGIIVAMFPSQWIDSNFNDFLCNYCHEIIPKIGRKELLSLLKITFKK